MSHYKFEKDKPENNSVLHVKEDSETPIIRLDAVVDYDARHLYDTLVATDLVQ